MKIVWGSLAAVAALSIAGAAHAQSKEYQPNGARVGSFTIFPSLTVGLEYTDNAFLEDTNTEDDTIARVRPGILARSNLKRHEIVAAVNGNMAFHSNNSDDNTYDYNARLGGTIEASRALRILPEVSYRAGSEPRGDDNVNGLAAEPSTFDVMAGKAKAIYKAGRVTLEGGAGAQYSDFNDIEITGGGKVAQDDRDRLRINTEAKIGYEFRSKTDVFVSGTYSMIDFDNVDPTVGQKRDSDIVTVTAGISHRPTARTEATIGAGYITQNFDNNAFGSVDGFAVNGVLAWELTKLTTITGRVERRIDQTTDANSSSELVWSGRLGVRHQLRRNVVIGGGVGYSNRLFEGGASNREDDRYEARAQADYYINRNFSVGAQYRFARRVSNLAGSGFSENRVQATVTARF
ncbi:MAG: outer membrane beta-barrel protein [Minwuia sp.]|nr:outer membrane beta-barrel protein [Minwuia sp.]